MPSLIRQDDLLLRLVKDVTDIRSALRRVVSNIPLFDIANENTPAQLTTDASNYVPGNYDVLRLTSDRDVTITGFRGGVKGRFLRLYNVGSYEITVSHESTLSDLENRVVSPTGRDMVINANGQLVLYYDLALLRWVSSWASSADRISCQLRRTDTLTVADSVDTPLEWQEEVKDTGNFWDVASPSIITFPETGWYDISAQVLWQETVASPTVYLRSVGVVDQSGNFLCADSRFPFDTNAYVLIENISRPGVYMQKGNWIKAIVFQTTGAGGTLVPSSAWFAGTLYTEINVVKR